VAMRDILISRPSAGPVLMWPCSQSAPSSVDVFSSTPWCLTKCPPGGVPAAARQLRKTRTQAAVAIRPERLELDPDDPNPTSFTMLLNPLH